MGENKPQATAAPAAKTITDHILSATAKPKPVHPDLFTGKRTCHRFMIPMQIPVQMGPQVGIEGRMSFMMCMGNGGLQGKPCALWNEERKECWDLTEKRAVLEHRDMAEQTDGLLRMLQEKS